MYLCIIIQLQTIVIKSIYTIHFRISRKYQLYQVILKHYLVY